MQMSERMGAEHYGEERAETAEAMAELIIAEELIHLGQGHRFRPRRGPSTELRTRSSSEPGTRLPSLNRRSPRSALGPVMLPVLFSSGRGGRRN